MVFEKLENYLDGLKKEYGIPFCRCRVTKNGETVFDFKAGDKYENQNLYYIYSMTKLVTAVAAMRLNEQKKLSLDDNIEKYLPEYADMKVKTADGVKKAHNKIKVRHLLSMQGGFNYDIETEEFSEAIRKNPDASTREMMSALAKRPLEFEAGEEFSYSLCYDVLGAVIEAAAGMKFGEYLKKEIFEPLGMNDTTFDLKSVPEGRMLPLYRFNNEKGEAEDISKDGNVYFFTPEYESGGAGIISTLDDYAEFIRTLANGGTSENGYKLIDDVNKENLKIIWDIIHPIEDGEDIETTWNYIGEHISHVHIKDGYDRKDETWHDYCYTPLGEGELPIEKVLDLLKRNEFHGFISFEWESAWRGELKGYENTLDYVLKQYTDFIK